MQTAQVAAAEVRAELARRGMTRDELASRSGIAPRTLNRRLNSIHPEPLRLDELDAIAAVFEVRAVDLLHGRQNKAVA